MYEHRLIQPLNKTLNNGYNLFFLNGLANRDCFYYGFEEGTLSVTQTLKYFFLLQPDSVADLYVQITQNNIHFFNRENLQDISPDSKIVENPDIFKPVQPSNGLFDDVPRDNNAQRNEQVVEMENQARENNVLFSNQITTLNNNIKNFNRKTVVYFDEFEWIAGLYATDKDGALKYIKCIQDLMLKKNVITIVNISDLELLKTYNFNLEENNSIYIGNPSQDEIALTFFRKYMMEFNKTNGDIQPNVFSSIHDVSQALSSSNKDLRGCLRIYRKVMDTTCDNQVIELRNFERAIEKILDEKISLDDVVLNYETKNSILNSVDSFLQNDDTKMFRKGVILTGPPGTGKTYLAKAIANDRNCYFMSPTLSDLKGEFIG